MAGAGGSRQDVALGGYVEPLPLEPAGSAACSSNGGCADLGLTAGDCCSLATTKNGPKNATFSMDSIRMAAVVYIQRMQYPQYAFG